MKLIINKKSFEKRISIVEKAINANSPLTSLQGILIIANESKIELIGSNGNLSIKEVIEVNDLIKVIEPGKTVINAKMFRNIIREQDETFTINLKENILTIHSNQFTADLQVYDVEDYPYISFIKEGQKIIIDSEYLNKVISNISYASAENDFKRIILNGVNLRNKDNLLIVTATDSFRLAQENFKIDTTNDFNATILTKNLRDFVPKNATGNIEINIMDNKFLTEYENTTVFSKLIDGIYPEVENLIPKSFKNIYSIDAKELIDLLDKVTALSIEGNKIVKLTITKDLTKIEAKRPEMSSVVVNTKEFNWNGDDFSIILNAKFLKDSLSGLKGKVALAFNGEFDAVVVKGKSNENITQLILPLRSY